MNRLAFGLWTLTLGLIMTAAAPAGTLSLQPDGRVTDWDLMPFTQSNGHDLTGPRFHTIANDYAPIDYPSVGYLPSPGGSTGEGFDLEQMHGWVTGDGELKVLVITGSGLTADAAGSTWHLGDLFVTAGDQTLAVVTQDSARGYAAGEVYAVHDGNDLAVLEDHARSYLHNDAVVANDDGPDAKVRDVVGPWQLVPGLDAGQKLGDAVLKTAMYDYTDAGEADTFCLEYTIDLTGLSLPETFDLNLHMTWGCGNDVIEADAIGATTVPEPASMVLFGLGALAILRRERPRTAA
ncbi:MAG: PEP-CTERM sorting domain-containing protein [Alphaproteobacteria bacterium]|jgi:hypothetical protein|nr:PEP-CTERM sorting domain-containing protein [Alphaproteobacteria bacterium]